jgi:hypothetical protein
LTQFDGVIGGDLLDCHAATDRLHGDSGLELGTVGAALAQLLRRRLPNDGSPFQGRYPASEVNDGSSPGKPVHLKVLSLASDAEYRLTSS